MYKTIRRAQIGTLVKPATREQAEHVQKLAGIQQRPRTSGLRALLMGIANLGTQRAMPGVVSRPSARRDPRDRQNW